MNKVLVEKVRNERPPWKPDSLTEVTEEIVGRFFDGSQYLQAVPPLDLELDSGKNGRQRDTMKFALPTEKEIEQVVRGEHPQSGAYALTLDELVQIFRNMKNDKKGVEEKVREVAARKCEVLEDPGNHRCLRWK